MTDRRQPVVVIGVGNPTRGDDGLGPTAVHGLSTQGLGHGIDVSCVDGEPTRLVDLWAGRELAIVIDAIGSRSAPGTIHQVEVGLDELPGWPTIRETHGSGIAEAISFSAALDVLPGRLVVLGIEGDEFTLGAGLSARVMAALPTLMERVHQVIAENLGRSDRYE